MLKAYASGNTIRPLVRLSLVDNSERTDRMLICDFAF